MSGFMDDIDDDEPEEEEGVIDVDPQGGDSRQGEPTDIEPSERRNVEEVKENSLVKPADEAEQIAALYDKFEEIKDEVLQSSDTTSISGNIHVNKSGWRKIATAFNVSVETEYENMWVEDEIVKSRVKAIATAPNGKSATGLGQCASNESNHMMLLADHPKKGDPDADDVYRVDGKWRVLMPPKAVNEHNILATAETRAKNRAISDLVGGGEVSAEEIKGPDDVLS